MGSRTIASSPTDISAKIKLALIITEWFQHLISNFALDSALLHPEKFQKSTYGQRENVGRKRPKRCVQAAKQGGHKDKSSKSLFHVSTRCMVIFIVSCLCNVSRRLMKVVLNTFFRAIYVVGENKFPSSGPVIIVANHSNQFIDAMVKSELLTPSSKHHFRCSSFIAARDQSPS